MTEARRFTVIDGQGEVDDDSAVLPGDYALLVEQNAKHLRTISGLKAALSRLHSVDPQAEAVEAVLVYWKTRAHGSSPRVQIPLDGARATAVRRTLKRLVEADTDPLLASAGRAEHAAALEDATDRALARIKAAIDGAVLKPFEGRYGKRFAEPQPGAKRKVDLVYILRDEVKMEQFIGLAEDDERRLAYRAELHHRLTTRPMEMQLLASFNPEYPEILGKAIRWAQSQCT